MCRQCGYAIDQRLCNRHGKTCSHNRNDHSQIEYDDGTDDGACITEDIRAEAYQKGWDDCLAALHGRNTQTR